MAEEKKVVVMIFEQDEFLNKLLNFIKSEANGVAEVAAVSEALPDVTESIDDTITEYLMQFGVPVHLLGFNYIRRAISLSIERPDIVNNITKTLYPALAKEFMSTPCRIERGIRHAIEVAWDKGNKQALQRIFKNTLIGKGKPTNSQFIATLADRLRLKLRKCS